MESLVDLASKFEIEWGQMILWVGMLGITVPFIKPANWFAKGVTSLITLITKLGGKGGDHLRIGGSKVGFDIEMATLTDVIQTITMICVFLVIYSLTGDCFPNRIG